MLAADKLLGDLAYVEEGRQKMNDTCLPATRVEVIDAITCWAAEAKPPASVSVASEWSGIHSAADHRVLWVCGVSGAGKSTIARSVAARLKELGRLGSFYAFDRSISKKTNPSTLFSTIARDLADKDPLRKQRLVSVIKDDIAMRKSLDCCEQFQNFIITPSAGLCPIGHTVLIIDAFDECGKPADRQNLLSLLTERAHEVPDGMRIIVTSRFEPDIQGALKETAKAQLKGVQLLLLENVPDAFTLRDVDLYMRDKLRGDLHPDQLEQLIAKAGQSFQWASTACRLITDKFDGDAATVDTRVHRLLESDEGLDALYREILDLRFGNSSSADLAPLITALGLMVTVLEPLPLQALSILASSEDELPDGLLKNYQQYFRLLASVIDGTHSEITPIKPLHASFADFLHKQLL